MNLHFAKAEKGELIFSNKKAVRDYLLTVDKKELWVRIERTTGKRSDPQNSWLWGVVYKLVAEHSGHTEQEIHEVFKRLFIPPVFKKILGITYKLPGSTTNLNKFEFSEYVEKIRAHVAEMGVVIPDADPSKKKKK